jgi:hypothetical protein
VSGFGDVDRRTLHPLAHADGCSPAAVFCSSRRSGWMRPPVWIRSVWAGAASVSTPLNKPRQGAIPASARRL